MGGGKSKTVLPHRSQKPPRKGVGGGVKAQKKKGVGCFCEDGGGLAKGRGTESPVRV